LSSTEYGGTSECRRIVITTNTTMTERLYTVNNGDPEAAIQDRSLPKLGSPHPTEAGLYVTHIEAERMPPNLCSVRVTWSREGYPTGDIGQDEEETEIAAEETTGYMDLDRNFLGEEGLSFYNPRMILTRTMYKSFFDRSTAEDICGKINKFYFAGKKKGLWLYLGATARKVGSQKYMIVHRFLFNALGHQPTTYKVKKVTSEDENGVEHVTYEVELGPDGNPILIITKMYEEGNFSLLGAGS